MSSSAATTTAAAATSAATATRRDYFCLHCRRFVPFSPAAACPLCRRNLGPNPNPNPNPSLAAILAELAAFDSIFAANSRLSDATRRELLLRLLSALHHLVHNINENGVDAHGAPPASRAAVAALVAVTVKEGSVAADEGPCAVCRDGFGVGDEAVMFPCRHFYHRGCVLPWLRFRNSCPVCRFELPTDDAEYEGRRRLNLGSGVGVAPAWDLGGSGGSRDGGFGVAVSWGRWVVERRFPIAE